MVKILLSILAFLYLTNVGYAQCGAGDPSINGPSWNFGLTIEQNFNAARRWEETDRGLTVNCLGNMTAPSGGWNALNDDETAFYIHNSERAGRGLLPFEGVETTLDIVSQNHAVWLHNNDYFDHTGDPTYGTAGTYTDCVGTQNGSEPHQRIDSLLSGREEELNPTENIAVLGTSGTSISDFVPRSMYLFIYQDQGSAWGHAHAIFWDYVNNNGSTAHEAMIGVGVFEGPGWLGFDCSQAFYSKILVINFFNPNAVATGFSFNTTLASELLVFEVKKNHRGNQLNWTTLTEENSSKFIVLKSTDGNDFYKIGEVRAAGQSTKKIKYQFVDGIIDEPVNYYKLVTADFDGQKEYSKIISIQNKLEITAIMSPNPVIRKARISFQKLVNESITLNIYNLSGKKIKSVVLTDSGQQIDFSDFLPGLYLATFEGQNKFIKPIKFYKL